MHHRPIVITAAEIVSFREAARDYSETRTLLASFRNLRASRVPFFLTGSDLELVFRWKLERQYGRNRHQRARNSEDEYRAITLAAFSFFRSDPSEEGCKKLQVLMCLDGVGIGVASAILALTSPERYCVIDFRGWRAMYGQDRRAFTISDYSTYRNDVAVLGSELGWNVQETDLALWAFDEKKEKKGRANQALQTTPMTRRVYEKTSEFGYPQRGV